MHSIWMTFAWPICFTSLCNVHPNDQSFQARPPLTGLRTRESALRPLARVRVSAVRIRFDVFTAHVSVCLPRARVLLSDTRMHSFVCHTHPSTCQPHARIRVSAAHAHAHVCEPTAWSRHGLSLH